VLEAPLAVCAARAASRQSSRIADASVVERVWREFADLGPLKHHAINTESKTIEQIADDLTQRIRGRLLDV
jgi:hypothetical protein